MSTRTRCNGCKALRTHADKRYISVIIIKNKTIPEALYKITYQTDLVFTVSLSADIEETGKRESVLETLL